MTHPDAKRGARVRLRPVRVQDCALLRRLCGEGDMRQGGAGADPHGKTDALCGKAVDPHGKTVDPHGKTDAVPPARPSAAPFSTVSPAAVENPYGRYYTAPRSFEQLAARRRKP